MITVQFNDRRAVPKKMRIGVKDDNLVEQVSFVLPEIADNQIAVLFWQNGDAADAVTLNNGVMNIANRMTQYSGQFTCFIEIRADGEVLWHSELFYFTIYDLPTISQHVDTLYPTAIEQGIETIQSIQNEMRDELTRYAPEVEAAINAANSAARRASSVSFQLTADMELEVTLDNVDNN